MKIIVPLLIISVITIVGLGIWMNSYLKTSSDKISSEVNAVEFNIQNNNWELASTKLSDINENWSKTKNIWSMLIDHAEIDNIDNALSKVESYMKFKDNKMAMSEIASLKLFIEHIPQRESFVLKNIF